MKRKELTKNISIFVLAVLIIAVYKTFDSLGVLFEYIGGFFRLILPIVGAFVIAFILHPICKKLEVVFKKSKSGFVSKRCRGFAITTIYLATLLVVAGFFAIILPMLFESITELVYQMPSIIEKIGKNINSLTIGGYTFKSIVNKISIADIMSAFNLSNVHGVVQGLAGFSKGIIDVFLAIIISIYILADRAGLLETADKIFDLIIPDDKRGILKKYLNRTFVIMYRYVYCQLLDAVIVFALSFVALAIMGVKYAPILAIFIGVFNLVPYFGATIACTLAAVLTMFTASFSKGVIVAIVLIVLQQLDANLIQPRLVRESLKVKPFWVLCGVLIGGGLFGMIGVLLAVPVMALIKTIFEDFCDYRESIDKKQ